MSLKAKVKAAVNKAFKAVGDLAVLASLSSKKVSQYDFNSRDVVASTSRQSVEVIITNTQKPSDAGFTVNAIMKSGIDIGSYDTLTVGKDVYSIVDYSDDGFTITAIIVKEK